MKYFENINDRAALKKEFHRLAHIHHPDQGGNAADFRELFAEYEQLLKTLPEIVQDFEEEIAAEKPKKEARRFRCPYRPTTAGGANPDVIRLSRPIFTHEEICKIARALFHWGKAQGDMTAFYRKVCRTLDPGQSLPYRDYFQDKKGAKKCMKMLREKGFRRIFEPDLWKVAREAERNLAA